MRAEHFVRPERQFEGGALQVAAENKQVVRVDQSALHAPFEDEIRVQCHVLVERVRACDEHRERRFAATSGAPKLLPQARQRARVAHHHARPHAPDIDAELQGVRRHHAADAAIAQPALHVAAFVRQVAAAVAGDALGVARLVAQRLAQVGEEQLHTRPAGREDDRLDAGADQPRSHVAGRFQRRLTDAKFAVHDWRVMDNDHSLAGGRAVVVHEGHLISHQRGGQFRRVSDRR